MHFLKLFIVCSAVGLGPQVALAQSAEHQRLSDELLQRWEQTALPPFLEDKRAMIDEVAETGLKMDVEWLRQMLDADRVGEVRKLSELVDWGVYSSFQHQSKLKYLVENLTNGSLQPRASDVHYSRFGVYLELHLRSDPKPFAWGDVELHFDVALLDRSDYHINPSWAYGNYNPDSASPLVNKGRVSFFLRKYLELPGSQNEFVFHEPVEMRYLKRIVVPTGKKQSLIEELRQNGVACPTAVGWEILIQEQPLPASVAPRRAG